MKRMYWTPVVIVVTMIIVSYYCIADGRGIMKGIR